MALTLALVLFGAAFATSAAGHGHAEETGRSHSQVGSLNAHKDGSSGDQHDLSRCGAIACTAVLLPRIGHIQLRLPSLLKPLVRHDIATDLSWARLDPPIPR